MMGSPIIRNMEGQTVTINNDSKVVIMELDNMFRKAGEILQWPSVYGQTAFGINRTILNFVIGCRFKLLIRYHANSTKEYWINYDKLRDFKKSVYCITLVSHSRTIYNIPVSLFKDKPTFSGAGIE